MDRITEIYDAVIQVGEEWGDQRLPEPIRSWYLELCSFRAHKIKPDPGPEEYKPPSDWALDVEFLEFKAQYPKRQGGENWKQVHKSWVKACKGHTVLAIIDGARRYREYCEAENKIDTSYVQQATTFLNQENWLKAWDVAAREFIKKPRIEISGDQPLPPSASELLARRKQRGLFDPQGSKS